ncbi:hypothetical protein [Sphingomonas immobilis]|uniref:Uncharacterized protein n=1 Tax=Sphingomonas immobilis TaxID=3063997 RepID=A0ABT9A356_9SPHN|nr:hypothetical protein [Sphingomonas sp. CA1-15]MDO7843769.1 hypothetical protein [Sphingomonas sp. CA1-15]
MTLIKHKSRNLRLNRYAKVWIAFREDVFAAVKATELRFLETKLTPFEASHSVVKRMAYEFVLQHRATSKFNWIEAAISDDRDEGRTIRTRFDDNHFHHVMFGLSKHIHFGNYSITKWNVSRFAKQLLYAERHEVPPEYLVGFLYQSGTISEIEAKVDDPNFREDWFRKKMLEDSAAA